MTDRQPDFSTLAGATDVAARVADLAARVPGAFEPLAGVAFNYRWSWLPDGDAVFRKVDPARWRLANGNPVRFLFDLPSAVWSRVERDGALAERAHELADRVAAELDRAPRDGSDTPGLVAYLCAEYGIHESLPLYAGGLGVLAGDTLKEASDQGLPFVAVGLFYRRGYHRQRLDASGRQLEHWAESDPWALPMARVSANGEPLKLSVDVFGATTWFQVWRVDVGRVPLLLIDADVPENDRIQRWYTARLYEGDRALRLAQYSLLGIGSVRVLRALGLDPDVFHLNEGHPALAALELVAGEVADGAPLDDALARVRERFVFTTHTPVPAGNETYEADELLAVVPDLPGRLGVDTDTFLGLFRTEPSDDAEPGGMTQLALRMSRTRNGVSRLHGEVAREMWRPFYPDVDTDEVPITHVTNGAHLPTFLSPAFRTLYDRHLGEDWERRAADPRTWEPVADIPDAELWAARCAARERLVEYARAKSELDGLQRGEELERVRSASARLDAGALTLGFARRLAPYKRVHLLAQDPGRASRLLAGERAVQLLIAGKAHPRDEEGKNALRPIFALLRDEPALGGRLVVLEDYDLAVGRELVAGCDVWINLPRRPMEASGTSGMKATFNGALQLSVLDGWWAEAFDGSNGWALPVLEEHIDPDERDALEADALYELLEHEVIPRFYERGDDGAPSRWCELMKAAIQSCAPRFTATRMLDDYVERVYGSPVGLGAGR
jgi:glycogen phosphorylase